MRRMRLGVFGAGGVGGYFGGRLAQAGHSVVFIARGPHLEAIRRSGMHVQSIAGDFAVSPAEATDQPALAGTVDAVLLCVKAGEVTEASRSLLPMLGADSFVLPLQNGVEAADETAAVVGPERVVAGLCRIVSYVAGPGRICHAGVAPRIELGERDRRRSDRVAALRAAFEACEGLAVETPDDIEVALWEKFLFIAPVGGVGAATGMPVGVFRRVPESRRLLEAAMREVFDVGRRRGVALPEDAVEGTLRYVDSLPEDTTASMQRDLLGGKASELEHQTGAIVRLGRAAGVAVPVNEFLYGSLLPRELRARQRQPGSAS
jgi:2-dehydropantoate 2-reductase